MSVPKPVNIHRRNFTGLLVFKLKGFQKVCPVYGVMLCNVLQQLHGSNRSNFVHILGLLDKHYLVGQYIMFFSSNTGDCE